jgi:hypothetical protein
VAVRLATDGVPGKALVHRHYLPGQEQFGWAIWNVEPVTGGPDAKGGIKAKGTAEYIEELPEAWAPPREHAGGQREVSGHVKIVPEPLAPLVALAQSVKAIEDAVRTRRVGSLAVGAAEPVPGGEQPAVQLPRFSQLSDVQVIQFVIQLRREHGRMNQKELASMLGTTKSRLSERLSKIFEAKERRKPKRGEALRWLDAIMDRTDALEDE